MAVEFALVKVRPTRIEQLIKEGNKRALRVKSVLDNLDKHLAAAQLGITLTSLGIGAVAEPAISEMLVALLHTWIPESMIHTISFAVAFLIATTLHITIGEQVPKMWAIERSENVSLWTAGPLYWFCRITSPFIVILNWLTTLCLRIVGVHASNKHDVHTDEEIKMIVSSSATLDPDEQKMVGKIFVFNERFIREIMVHRKDMECIYLSDPIDETIAFVKGSNHSRFPVCGEDRDDILGYINVKDLYKLLDEKQPDECDLNDIIREIPRFYETNTVKNALKTMQKNRHQISIIIDEYGGVCGLVTLEDIVEEIIGEIQDEYDDEEESIVQTKEGIIVDGSLLIDEVTDELGIELEDIDGIDTIGGYVLSKLVHTPKVGNTIEVEGYRIRVIEVDKHRISKLYFQQVQPVISE